MNSSEGGSRPSIDKKRYSLSTVKEEDTVMLMDKTAMMPPGRPTLLHSDQKLPPLETLEESAFEEKFASSRCEEEFKKVFKIFVPPLETKKVESNIQLGAEGTK
jgi:hypothetical protein